MRVHAVALPARSREASRLLFGATGAEKPLAAFKSALALCRHPGNWAVAAKCATPSHSLMRPKNGATNHCGRSAYGLLSR